MAPLLSTYDPLPISFVRGQGVWIWDEQGNRFLDAISGLGVNILGYDQPEWVHCIQQQAAKLVHVSNLYTIVEQKMLATTLCEKSGMEKAFFTNSGSETNECAIKLARLYGHSKNIPEPTIIVFDNAYHGRTLATLTASGSRQVQAGFEPLASGFVRAPFGDIRALEAIAQSRQNIVAVLFEPIQGSGGIHVAFPEYLQAMRTLCDQQQWLMIADEIQTGMGRTGKFLFLQHYQVQADIVTLAKGLANGIPIGACLTRGVVNELMSPGKHGSTLGGNPFACTVALKTLELMDKLDLIANARLQGDLLFNILNQQLGQHPHVKSIRGKGLMIGIELDKPCKKICKIAASLGLLINVTQQNVVRLLPPLVIQSQEVEILAEKLVKAVEIFYTS